MDRLILELKLPPADAYFKILHTLEEINNIITSSATSTTSPSQQRISPELGNVCFAAGQHGWSFSLLSFATKYCAKYPTLNPTTLAKRLWGDWYFNPDSRTFTRAKVSSSSSRSFVQFILEPIYKIYSVIIGEGPKELSSFLRKIEVKVSTSELHLDAKPLLKTILSRYFGAPSGLVSMMTSQLPSPPQATASILPTIYSGSLESKVGLSMLACKGGYDDALPSSSSSSTPLMIHVVKLYSSPDGASFLSLGRIYSGTVKYIAPISDPF